MRHTITVAATSALVTAIIAIWGTTIIIAHGGKPEVTATTTSIDVMSMMKNVKGLPEETFDAH